MFSVKCCTFILCMTIFCLFRCCTSFQSGVRFIENDNHEFDVLIFTQSWPVTTCITWMETNPDHVCILPSPKEIWEIHGIWPTRFGSIGPAFCNRTAHFDVHQLDPLVNQLEQFWMNIEKGKPLDSLWEHEWLKHGTCAAVIPELGNENKYFGQGLSWLQQYTMSSLLPKANIVPDQEYHVADIYNAVKKLLNKNPAIHCVVDRETHESYLSEIRICFDKGLKLVDCDGVVKSINKEMNTNCATTKPISYPSKLPHYLLKHIQNEREQERDWNWRHPVVNIFKLVNLLKFL